MGMRSFEFDLDLASDGQVGGGKKTNSAFAKTDAAAIDDSRVSRVIDLDPHRGVKGKPLPAAAIYRLLHSIQLPELYLAEIAFLGEEHLTLWLASHEGIPPSRFGKVTRGRPTV